MKIALCYYGNLGWKLNDYNEKVDLNVNECFQSIKKHIIDFNNAQVDIFVHTWSHEAELDIVSTLNPKAILSEPPKTFPNRKEWRNEIKNFADFKGLIIRKLRMKFNNSFKDNFDFTLFKLYSRWYSTKKVIELKAEYERINRFEYDYVMLLRFDIEFYKNVDFSLFKPNKFYSSNPSCYYLNRHNFLVDTEGEMYNDFKKGIINEPFIIKLKRRLSLNDSIFWCQASIKVSLLALFGIIRYSLSDTWFISDTKTMNKFGNLYDSIQNYPPCPHQSSYIHITKYLKPKDLEFPFSQLKDFEIRRYSREFGASIPDWVL
jgi:hypothetical protein